MAADVFIVKGSNEMAMNFLKEFKVFANKGNVLDLAVGIVIGSAFSKITTSLVNDVITPIVSIFTGRIHVADLRYVLRVATDDLPELAISYGAFLQAAIDFLIISMSIFLAVRLINRMKKKEAEKPAAPPPPPVPSKEETLLSEIRDILKGKRDIA